MVVVSVEVGVLVAVEVGVGPSFSSPALCFCSSVLFGPSFCSPPFLLFGSPAFCFCSSVLFEPPDTHFPETILDPTFVITDPKI